MFVLEEQQRRVRDRNLSRRIKGKKRTKEKEQGTFVFIIFFKFTKKCVCLINNNDCLNLVSVWTISYKTYTRFVVILTHICASFMVICFLYTFSYKYSCVCKVIYSVYKCFLNMCACVRPSMVCMSVGILLGG